jgi:hypothetical protein
MLPEGILVRLTVLHGGHSEGQHATHDGERHADGSDQHDQAAPGWRLVIIIGNRCHRSSRISASGNVQQEFVFLILIHVLPRRITSQPSKKKPGP